MTFIRYVGVQIAAYAVDMGGFLALLHFGITGPVIANLLAKACAGLFAFSVHRAFTFGITGPSRRGMHAIRYFVLLAINAPLSSAILAAFLHVIPHAAVAKIVADVLTVVLSYFLTARVVFGRSHAIAPSKPREQRQV